MQDLNRSQILQHNIQNVQDSIENHPSYQEQGKTQLEKSQSTNINSDMLWMLELSDKVFKTAIIKILQ